MPEGQLIAELTAKAIQTMQDRICTLESIVALHSNKIAALEAIASHQVENQEIQLKLICQLKEAARKEPQSMQKDRADILGALIVANGGKMLAKDAGLKMHIKRTILKNSRTFADYRYKAISF
ncbi:MAG: hypothetical protein A4E49_01476 [Methanosaeta sp. PtaU1.Bin112]|nr:MAG: hypothetical protein A4E49_01476 [Methanosaeta sp. PtaU1.Bin112]